MPSAMQHQQKETRQLHSSKLGCSPQGSTTSPRYHEAWGSAWPNDIRHVLLEEEIVLEEEIAQYLPTEAWEWGEKRPHACQISLFVMMSCITHILAWGCGSAQVSQALPWPLQCLPDEQ